MTCQEAEPLLARAADGSLGTGRNPALARHLRDCAACREALAVQRAARDLLAGRPDVPVPPGFATRVMANLPQRQPPAAAAWLEVLNWRAWTLRLAPVAGALFVWAALGLGPSEEIARAGAVEFSDLATAWVDDAAAGDDAAGDAAGAGLDTASWLWQGENEVTDDLLLDVLLAADPAATGAELAP